jgi:hypothetical protein
MAYSFVGNIGNTDGEAGIFNSLSLTLWVAGCKWHSIFQFYTGPHTFVIADSGG